MNHLKDLADLAESTNADLSDDAVAYAGAATWE